MKLGLLFVILVSSPLAFSQNAAQVRVIDKNIKSFFKKATSVTNPKCQYAKELFGVLSKVVVRDLGDSNYDITGDLPTLPHVWIELRSSDNSCKSGYFISSINLPDSPTTYIQTSFEKQEHALDEDIDHFFKSAIKNGRNGSGRGCWETERIYKDLRNVKIRDLGDLNFFITGTINNESVFLELEHSDNYRCEYGHITDIDPGTNKPKPYVAKPVTQAPREPVCEEVPTCTPTGYYSQICGTTTICH
jgi:hypothetical protein